MKRYLSMFLLVALLLTVVAFPAAAAQPENTRLPNSAVNPVPPANMVIDITKPIGGLFQEVSVLGTVTLKTTRIGPVTLRHYEIQGKEYRLIDTKPVPDAYSGDIKSVTNHYIVVPVNVPVKSGFTTLSGYTLPFSVMGKHILVLYSGKF